MEFEKKLDRLEEIVVKMEEGDLSLDESLKLFEEGIHLSRQCHSEIDQAEQKVKLLLKVDENGDPITEDFQVSDS